MNTTQATIKTQVGALEIVVDDADALTAVRFLDTDVPTVDPTTIEAPGLREAARQLSEYFDGERTDFDLVLAPEGTAFQKVVWRALREIPYGVTESYGQLAARIGQPTASRAVGLANGRNPIPIIVPCHRVIGSNGTLTGYAGGVERKRWLLDHEQGSLLA